MKKNKMIIAAVVLLLVFVVGGAIAYFTDSENTTNTFTIGSVAITLTEPAWTDNGGEAEGTNMLPGETAHKDPTVTVDSTSQDAFVLIGVTIPCLDGDELLTFTPNEGWEVVESVACPASGFGSATRVYSYSEDGTMTKVTAGNSATLFNTVTLINLTNAQATALAGEDIEMGVTGYGIQADGLESTTNTNVWGYFE